MYHCLVYIDLNMVRAGVAEHRAEWPHSGYREIQELPERYAAIDLEASNALCGIAQVAHFQEAHRRWVREALTRGAVARDERCVVGGDRK